MNVTYLCVVCSDFLIDLSIYFCKCVIYFCKNVILPNFGKKTIFFSFFENDDNC